MTPVDKYSCFKELQDYETEGVDFKVRSRVGTTGIALICIHGGDIEPGTSEIADGIAGHDHTFYALEGIKTSGNKTLHITSTAFDEPAGLEIICLSEIIVSVHGCSETGELVHIGGLDHSLKQQIEKKLNESGFQALIDSNPRFRAFDQKNVCNLCGRGMGVQFEISRGLRERMFKDLGPQGRRSPLDLFYKFVKAVRDALEPFHSPEVDPPESAGWEIMR
ncbi:conserved hypothetical protein [Syntrophobacter sp. SbD1]|nr:conserved hypothetical protein [Syntrophobacter sp. SbD1]